MNPHDSSKDRRIARSDFVEEELSRRIVGCFFDVYNELGPGLFESLYSRALEIAVRAEGLHVEREYPIAVRFRGQQIGFQRVDMLVERRIIIENKSTEFVTEAARHQLRCYLKAMRLDLGLLLHFGPRPNFYRELGGWPRSRPGGNAG
jgi:GxxExxY protein